MSEFVFFIKISLLTLALIFLMQIEIGGRSLEMHAQRFIYTSPVVQPLHSVAHGTAQIVREFSKKIVTDVKARFKTTKREED